MGRKLVGIFVMACLALLANVALGVRYEVDSCNRANDFRRQAIIQGRATEVLLGTAVETAIPRTVPNPAQQENINKFYATMDPAFEAHRKAVDSIELTDCGVLP